MTAAYDKWLAANAANIANIKAGNLTPYQQATMALMTHDWQHNSVFIQHGSAPLRVLEAAGLIEHQACMIHYAYGDSPTHSLKSTPPEGTDEPSIEWRLKQA